MALLQFTKHSNMLVPADPATTEFLQTKIRAGAFLTAEFRQVRNPAFHRRFFALLNLAFDYWEPTGGAVSDAERRIVNSYARWLAVCGADAAALMSSADQYLSTIAERRAGRISVCKSFDAFRAWVVTEAGFYDVIALPDGSCRRTPRSMSFASMDETEFHELYRAAFDVLWRFVLSHAFASPQEAENAAAQLMNFAG